MKTFVIFGICAVIVVEAVAFAASRDALPVLSGAVAAVVLLAVRWGISATRPATPQPRRRRGSGVVAALAGSDGDADQSRRFDAA